MSSFRFIFLVIFACFELQFSVNVYCTDFEPAKKYSWDVEEDEVTVEAMVVQYAHKISLAPATLLRLFSTRIIRRDPDTRQEVDFRSIQDDDKLLMCNASIRLNYFGLEFQKNDQHNLNVAEQHISLQWLSHDLLPTGDISMFQCPMLQYVDLETGEPIDLLIKYYISGTHLRDSFFLYLQEGSHLPIYPHKFVTDVKLATFDELRPTYELAEYEYTANAEKMSVHFDMAEIEARLTEFMDSRNLKDVYTKFRNLYKSMVICGMPRAHIIASCRYIAHNMDLEVDHRGYDEFNCRKRQVFSKPAESEESKSVFVGLFQTVKCPAVASEVDANINKFSAQTMFLAASQRYISVFVFKRFNYAGQKLIPEAALSALRLPTLRRDRNRTREFLKPHYVERKPRYSDLTTTLIRLSGLDTFSRGPPSITFNRNAVEDSTIILMRLKEAKKPYDRFGASYSSININMWPKKDVEFLCHLILQDETYNLNFESNGDADKKFKDRLRIQVQLIMRDAELLDSRTSVARQCPRGFQTSSTYFIQGTIFKDAITVHVKYEDNNFTFPEAYVQNINKNVLRYAAKVVGQKSLLDREDKFKEAFCRFILQPKENGFEFDIEKYNGPSIEPHKFTLPFITETQSAESYGQSTQESDQSARKPEQSQETGDQPARASPQQQSDPRSEPPSAELARLSVEIPGKSQQGPDPYELPMYDCPQILYFDLELNDVAGFPYIFRVSDGEKYDSAIVFFQEYQSSALYPMKYVKNISFSKLMKNYGDQTEEIIRPSRSVQSLLSIKDMESATILYLVTKRISRTYEKFTKLYDSMNICAYRRLAKIHTCRSAMQNYYAYIDIDTIGYDEYVCRKIQIYFEGEERQAYYNPNKSLYVLQCPPTFSIIGDRRDKFSDLHYLSSNVQRNSGIFFTKVNIKGENFVLANIDSNLNAEFIQKDKARERFTPYPSRYDRKEPVYRKSYEEIQRLVNAVNFTTVQMPVTYASYERIESRPRTDLRDSLRVFVDRWLVDDVLIEFSRARKNTFIYQRFAALYASLDVCQLSLPQKRDLCHYILSDVEYHIEVTSTTTEFNYSCKRNIISLTSRDADYLESKTFSTWQCPEKNPIKSKYRYYIGKNHLRDAAVLYRFSKEDTINFPNGVFYPDATVINISRLMLAYAGKPTG